MRHVHDGSEFAVIAFDANHSPNGKLRHVSFEAEFTVLVRVLQYGCSSESSLQASNEAFSLSPKLNTTSLQVKSTMG